MIEVGLGIFIGIGMCLVSAMWWASTSSFRELGRRLRDSRRAEEIETLADERRERLKERDEKWNR